jgi:predicted nucleotidyltransferase component of viral defense system
MTLNEIKKHFYAAVFADDTLMESLVLKGGSAISSFYDFGGGRVSLDIDFSMSGDFEDKDIIQESFERTLTDEFRKVQVHVFDLKLKETPSPLSAELESFWGGYTLEFKIIGSSFKDEDISTKRRNAIVIEGKGKFTVDISKHEYVDSAEEKELDDSGIITLKVYTPAMIICEKLRAICQQLPEYGPIVKRTYPGASRARDFYDIFILAEKYHFRLADSRELLKNIFEIKRVPITFLERISMKDVKRLHEDGYSSLKDTVVDRKLEPFSFYYDYVVTLVKGS